MPKVNPERDDTMARAGYLRASNVAKLFGVKTSTVIRWPDDPANKIINIKANGLNWLMWTSVYVCREQEALIRKLPADTKEALQRANKLA